MRNPFSRPDSPELDVALRERDAATKALNEHSRAYPGAPDDRLERDAWDAITEVARVTREQRAAEIAERQAPYREATAWLREAEGRRHFIQQMELNRETWPFDRRAVWADRFGMKQAAEQIREHVDSTLRIADKMERCPNNPNNGGDGYNYGSSRWVDRRAPGSPQVEDDRELEERLSRVDPLTAESQRTEEIVQRAKMERQLDEWSRSPDNPRNWERAGRVRDDGSTARGHTEEARSWCADHTQVTREQVTRSSPVKEVDPPEQSRDEIADFIAEKQLPDDRRAEMERDR
ncbi:MAG: hypothetical protein ACRDTZ_00065 [Pseudonocardiaceae bacterium]